MTSQEEVEKEDEDNLLFASTRVLRTYFNGKLVAQN